MSIIFNTFWILFMIIFGMSPMYWFKVQKKIQISFSQIVSWAKVKNTNFNFLCFTKKIDKRDEKIWKFPIVILCLFCITKCEQFNQNCCKIIHELYSQITGVIFSIFDSFFVSNFLWCDNFNYWILNYLTMNFNELSPL